ncbi:unnamed protein product, partial [Ectocarpus sp. 13 AM-2016]
GGQRAAGAVEPQISARTWRSWLLAWSGRGAPGISSERGGRPNRAPSHRSLRWRLRQRVPRPRVPRRNGGARKEDQNGAPPVKATPHAEPLRDQARRARRGLRSGSRAGRRCLAGGRAPPAAVGRGHRQRRRLLRGSTRLVSLCPGVPVPGAPFGSPRVS